jgi:ferric-dicitrate binding protein FerR (iron transport regulator)
MNRPDITAELIRRYLRGECTAEEAARVDAWFNAFEGEPDLLHTLSPAEREALDRRMLDRIKSRIAAGTFAPHEDATEADASGVETASVGRNRFRVGTLAALSGAAAAVLLALGVLFYGQRPGDKVTPGQGTVASATVTVTNPSATLRRQLLADGSEVWLHPGSRLTYPRTFAGGTREVTLSGEAFFNVTRDPSRPFLIRSGDLLTRVLGTSFSIKAYENAPSAEVVVVTGKVSVRLAGAPAERDTEVLLTPRQRVTYEKAARRLARGEVPSGAKRSLWETSTLAFENASLRDIIGALNAHFDVRIAVESPAMLNCRLRADFNGQHLPAILEMIGESVDATYRIDGNAITLEGDGCTE